MNLFKWYRGISLEDRKLYYKLNTVFIMLLLFPVLGLSYLVYEFDLFSNELIKLFYLIALLYIFIGFALLRKVLVDVVSFSENLSQKISKRFSVQIDESKTQNELQRIINIFSALENKLATQTEQLSKKSTEILTLKEVSDICYITFDPSEILHVTLERALYLVNADIGSVLILSGEDHRFFTIKASIGRTDVIKLNDRVDFDKSIAKYAVINKAPLVIENIETERRFGRMNKQSYGSKSFICVPIRSIRNIIGVLTISSSDKNKVFSHADVDALIPLLGNAAFAYENIRLLHDAESKNLCQNKLEKIFKTLNSSLRYNELVHTLLTEMRELIAYEQVMILECVPEYPDAVSIGELFGGKNIEIVNGEIYDCKGTVIDKTIRQESIHIIEDDSQLNTDIERKLLVRPDCKYCLLSPISSGMQVTGALVLFTKKEEIFHEKRQFIVWLSALLALAQRENQLSIAATKRNKELASIKQIGRLLASSSFDTDKVFQYTMDMIRMVMNVEAGSFALMQDNGELEFTVAFGVDTAKLIQHRIKLGQGIAGSVASRGEPLLVNDVKNSAYFYPEVDSHTGFKTNSILCVPLISQGKIVGVIEVINKINGYFTHDDIDLLQTVAASVSIALENSKLYKEKVVMAEHERGLRSVFQKFVPMNVVDQILHGSESGNVVLEEFKTLTLLNIDIRGFSILTREIGPQKSVALLNYFFSVMGDVVFKNHGIVDKYLGDGFLALFGAPVSSTTDAENAVIAALEMKKSISLVNDFSMELIGEPVNIGISIHTGEVVVGNIGFDMKMDYTVIGDPVNMVFRIQDLTKTYPNGILISEDTKRATRSSLEVKELKEMYRDLKLYELLGIKKR